MQNSDKGAVAGAYGVVRRASKRTSWFLVALLVAMPAAAEVRIAALGDSLTQGFGLQAEEGFVPRLEAWLHENGAEDVTVINAGVSGDTTAGGRSRVDWMLADTPDGVIVALGGNDILRGLDPAATRANVDAILARLASEDLPVLLAGLPGPGNFGPEYRDDFEAIWPDLANQYDAILYPNFLAGIADRLEDARARGLMQDDGIHPNAAGVEAMVADIGPKVLQLVERARN